MLWARYTVEVRGDEGPMPDPSDIEEAIDAQALLDTDLTCKVEHIDGDEPGTE